MPIVRFIRASTMAAVLSSLASVVAAQSAPKVHTATPQSDPGVYSGRLKVDYPTPYGLARPQDVRSLLERIHAYVSEAAPVRVVNGESGEPVTDFSKLPPQVALARTDLQIVTYEWGVTYAGMMLLAQVTGDRRYDQYTDERVTAIARLAAHARRQLPPGTTAANYPRPAHGIALRGMLLPARLDDGGAMCAALIKAQRAGLGSNTLRPWIDNWLDWVHSKQFRLEDGTLARNRPLPNTLWLDDLYMSVPCLAQAGKLTGEARYYDDAAKQVLQFADRMFVKDRKLFMHAWVQEMDYHPAFHWARANGWAIMAMAELLDVLPETHPARARILALYRQHAQGLIANQGHAGLWHQLLDRRESYEETSASAMYVFALARGINRGWLDAAAFGPPVSLGWNAIAKKVNAKGQVEGVCVGTGVGWDPAFYMYRPVHLLAAHGYGPMFLAGAEMLELLKRPDVGLHDGGLQFGRPLEN
jgi:unsaturated rhamnogalacturonyl hydrolase